MKNNLVPLKSALPKTVLVYIYDDGEQITVLDNGLELITGLDDTNLESIHNAVDSTHPGIRGRWAIVVSAKEDTPSEFAPGTKVFLDEMKWSRGFIFDNTGRKVNTMPIEDILLIDTDGFTEWEQNKINEWLSRGS